MSIPDFQSIMLPLLELAGDSKEYKHQNLAQELLERIKTASPAFFERLTIELLVKMGYGGSLVDAAMAIGKKGSSH